MPRREPAKPDLLRIQIARRLCRLERAATPKRLADLAAKYLPPFRKTRSRREGRPIGLTAGSLRPVPTERTSAQVLYDPANGTISAGDATRTRE